MTPPLFLHETDRLAAVGRQFNSSKTLAQELVADVTLGALHTNDFLGRGQVSWRSEQKHIDEREHRCVRSYTQGKRHSNQGGERWAPSHPPQPV